GDDAEGDAERRRRRALCILYDELLRRDAHCFPESDHQLLTNLGFMFLDEVLGERNDGAGERAGVERDAQGNVLAWRGVTRDVDGRVVDWHGLEVATYNEATQCLEYRTPTALVINKANAVAGVELVEIAEHQWPAAAAATGVSLVCTLG